MTAFFKIPVQAETAEQALEASRQQHGRAQVTLVRDTLQHVLTRLNYFVSYAANDNELDHWTSIYGTVDQLQRMAEPEPLIVMEALILCSDPRLLDKERVCALWEQKDRWWIFGLV